MRCADCSKKLYYCTSKNFEVKQDQCVCSTSRLKEKEVCPPTILNDMVKAVYVHASDKSKGYREQQIDISYDLVGILPASLLNDLQKGKTA